MKHRITGQSFEVWDDTAQSWFVLCSAFGVDEVLVDTLTGKHQVTAFVDSARSGRNTITFPRDNIRQKVVMKALCGLRRIPRGNVCGKITDQYYPVLRKINENR